MSSTMPTRPRDYSFPLRLGGTLRRWNRRRWVPPVSEVQLGFRSSCRKCFEEQMRIGRTIGTVVGTVGWGPRSVFAPPLYVACGSTWSALRPRSRSVRRCPSAWAPIVSPFGGSSTCVSILVRLSSNREWILPLLVRRWTVWTGPRVPKRMSLGDQMSETDLGVFFGLLCRLRGILKPCV